MILNATNAAKFIIAAKGTRQAQVGIDLTIKKINAITDKGMSSILKDKTILDPKTYEEVKPDINGIFTLKAGYYDFQFNEGIKLDAEHTGLLFQRSSLARTGVIFSKSIFDPGFGTGENTIGTSVFLANPLRIELGARVGQMVILQNEETDEYKGQFNNEAQKNNLEKE